MTGPGEESGGSSANLFSPQRLDPLRARLIQSGLGGEQVADVLQKARSRIMHQCQRVVAENPDLVGEIQQHEMLSGPVDEAAIDEPLMVTVALYLQKRAMRQLPPQQQEALLLHANEAMSHREIARQLGISRDKALCILAKAYADLQLSLRGSQPESAFGEESCVDSRGTACVEKSIRVSAAQFLLQWRAGDLEDAGPRQSVESLKWPPFRDAFVDMDWLHGLLRRCKLMGLTLDASSLKVHETRVHEISRLHRPGRGGPCQLTPLQFSQHRRRPASASTSTADTDGARKSLRWLTALPLIFAAIVGGLVATTGEIAAQKYYFDVNLSTLPGQRKPHVLPDNSIVHLGADSAISVDFTDRERSVILRRGEARFSVEHDPQRPFVVRTIYGEEVKAVGTEFLVAYREGATVAIVVSEGRVAVKAPRSVQSSSAQTMPEIALGANQQLLVAGQRVPVPERVDGAKEMQWMMSFADVDHKAVGKIVAELNRRNELQIVIDDATIDAFVIGFMRVNMSDPESFADFIATRDLMRGEGGIVAERVGARTIHLKRNSGVTAPRLEPKSRPQTQR